MSHAPSHAPRRTYGQRQREQRGWYFYDWANSAFSTTVVTVFLGPYLTTIAENAADSRGFVHPLGIPVRDGSFFSYVVGLSVALQVISFQTMRRRIFLMAPIHHHFELRAWSETKIILRFWIVAAICAAIGFTIYRQSIG